ncbi:MAG: AAA family ATPase [Gemmatimonadaceae bacterium]|jgi:NadR type nicotinamide-nucleotide adenylyltransferase
MASTRRVVLIGPESTGKTTLATEVAAAFEAPWTPESARLIAESTPEPLSAATIEPIARRCIALEDAALATHPSLLIRDTDLVSTVVYARHYYGHCPAWIEAEAQARLGDLYLLCAPDLPWTADGIRDRPDSRESLFADFERELTRRGAHVVVIRGTGEARREAARGAVREMLKAEGSRLKAEG